MKILKKIFNLKMVLLLGIIVLALVARFYKLGQLPALNADEASNGYDAYSLILTGKDQHGNVWPIHFQSFNDYKPGLYVYLDIPFIKLMGLTVWAVRIPGALAGVLSVFVIYLLVKELFGKERLALISSLFLAISPWHIHFSRGGWEVNVATFFMLVGVWLFVRSMNAEVKLKPLIFSVLAFVASLYTYHAERVVIPLLGFTLLVIYWKQIKKNIKLILVAGVVGLVLVLPLARDIMTGAVASRAAGVGLFADPGPRSRIDEQRGEHSIINSLLAKALHNKVVNYGLAFVSNWFVHYWGEFLFLSGDIIQRNRVPETGQMYLTDIVFVVIGLYVMIKSFDRKKGVVFAWLLFAPVAAALTFQAPHALRAHNMVIPIVIVSAFGFDAIISWLLTKKKIKTAGLLILGILITWGFARYEHMYWVHMAKEYPYSSQYGVPELVDYVKGNEDKYQKILVTDRYDQPYVLFLFYMKYDPTKFQAEHSLTAKDQYGFSTVNHFGKYYFATIKFQQAKEENPNTLIAGTSEEIVKEANIVKDIYGTNGFLYFRVVAN